MTRKAPNPESGVGFQAESKSFGQPSAGMQGFGAQRKFSDNAKITEEVKNSFSNLTLSDLNTRSTIPSFDNTPTSSMNTPFSLGESSAGEQSSRKILAKP